MPNARVNGANLYYEEQGDGFPLLLLLPLGCVIEHLREWVEVFSEKYRVLIADLRGCGGSELTAGPYTIELLASDAAALLDHLHIERAHVAGASLGGHIALELALARPDLVDGLVLALTGARSNARTRQRLRIWRELKENGHDELFAREVSLWVFGNQFYEDERTYQGTMRSIAQSTGVSRQAYLALVDAAIGFDALDRLGSITSRTLCFGGEEDICFNRRQVQELAGAIPGARLEMLDCAHALLGESCESFLRITREFLG